MILLALPLNVLFIYALKKLRVVRDIINIVAGLDVVPVTEKFYEL